MNKGMFTGWQDVFSFTFRQNVTEKFKKVTIILALILLLGGMSISVIMAFVQKKSATKVSPIETVYVINDSELGTLNLELSGDNVAKAFPKVTFDYSADTVEEVQGKLQGEDNANAILHIQHEKESYQLELFINNDGAVSEKQGEDLLDALKQSMEISKLLSSEIPMEKLALVVSGVHVSQITAGENEKGVGEELMRTFVPMIFILVIYMMTLIYGMAMGNAVSVEKTSKLMEMMLTMTKPYSMILGKILAMTATSVMQAMIWIASFVGGFFLGDVVAKQVIYTDYTNAILLVFDMIAKQDGSKALSAPAVILGLLTMCVAFLFYFLLAATFGSFATKAEDLGQALGFYQMFVMLGFFGSYLIPLQEIPWLTTLMRFIPVTSAFLLPGDIVIGNVKLWQGGLYTLLLVAFTFVLIFVAGKVYKSQVFYRGENVLSILKKKFSRK